MPQEPQRVLLVFRVGGQTAALPLEDVQTITLMAQVARPPGLPTHLEGLLNLAGKAVPVLRLDRLFQLPVQDPALYSVLIILKNAAEGAIALLADRVSDILQVPQSALLPAGKDNSFNACAEAVVSAGGQAIPLLSPGQILLEKERQRLADFQATAQRRLEEWGAPRES